MWFHAAEFGQVRVVVLPIWVEVAGGREEVGMGSGGIQGPHPTLERLSQINGRPGDISHPSPQMGTGQNVSPRTPIVGLQIWKPQMNENQEASNLRSSPPRTSLILASSGPSVKASFFPS